MRRSGWLFLELQDDALCMYEPLKHFVVDFFRNALNDLRIGISLKVLRSVGEDFQFLLFDVQNVVFGLSQFEVNLTFDLFCMIQAS